MLVFVHPLLPIKQVMECGGGIQLGTAGAGIAAQIKYAQVEGHVQVEKLAAGETQLRMFQLGPGAKAAYVTAALVKNTAWLLCRDRLVTCGWCLRLGVNDWFLDPVLTARAPT